MKRTVYFALLVIFFDTLVAFSQNKEVINIPDSSFVIKTTDGQTITLSDLHKDSYVLIFRFYDLNCGDCVKSTLSIMNRVFNADSSSIVLLASYTRQRDLNVLMRQNRIKFPVYNVTYSTFQWLTNDEYQDCSFVLNSKNQFYVR